MSLSEFEHIRPYTHEEINPAMHRIADSAVFSQIASFVFPEMELEEARCLLKGIRTTDEFQHRVMAQFNEQVIARSISRFTYSGLEHLDPSQSYLFVSNHRDIMLDSSLLQYVLHVNGHQTSEITFGANLMCHPVVIDIGKSNKMFRVERGVTTKELYHSSLLNSRYIRHALTQKKQSVWIAQRNGRTKDGIDRTEPGLISMFAASRQGSLAESLAELQIVPVSISYEWETCDLLKARELYESRFGPYVKQPGEDLNSILTGIMAQKGDVHIEVCKPISLQDLREREGLPKADYVKAVASLIDERINRAYVLHPGNYIAADLLSGVTLYSDRYTPEQLQAFRSRMEQLECFGVDNRSLLQQLFLQIYANPVKHHA